MDDAKAHPSNRRVKELISFIKTPFSRGIALAPKEIETAKEDLEKAAKTYKEGGYKWTAIIKTIRPHFLKK